MCINIGYLIVICLYDAYFDFLIIGVVLFLEILADFRGGFHFDACKCVFFEFC